MRIDFQIVISNYSLIVYFLIVYFFEPVTVLGSAAFLRAGCKQDVSRLLFVSDLIPLFGVVMGYGSGGNSCHDGMSMHKATMTMFRDFVSSDTRSSSRQMGMTMYETLMWMCVRLRSHRATA
jgi:hypothetical protein